MGGRIFLAGAADAIGRRLVPLLNDAGHHAIGTTQWWERADALGTPGAEPAVVDVLRCQGFDGGRYAGRLRASAASMAVSRGSGAGRRTVTTVP